MCVLVRERECVCVPRHRESCCCPAALYKYPNTHRGTERVSSSQYDTHVSSSSHTQTHIAAWKGYFCF